MAAEFGSDWTTGEELYDINIVPLVDVLLVLLVIFMITAPIITDTLDVQLPRASLSPGTRTNQTLIITVGKLEAILPKREQIFNEVYKSRDRIRATVVAS